MEQWRSQHPMAHSIDMGHLLWGRCTFVVFVTTRPVGLVNCVGIILFVE
jgi:hypothetical protein